MKLDSLIADLQEPSPLIVSLLIKSRVDCVGCFMNKYCTLEELGAQYVLNLENILGKIQETLTNHVD